MHPIVEEFLTLCVSSQCYSAPGWPLKNSLSFPKDTTAQDCDFSLTHKLSFFFCAYFLSTELILNTTIRSAYKKLATQSGETWGWHTDQMKNPQVRYSQRLMGRLPVGIQNRVWRNNIYLIHSHWVCLFPSNHPNPGHGDVFWKQITCCLYLLLMLFRWDFGLKSHAGINTSFWVCWGEMSIFYMWEWHKFWEAIGKTVIDWIVCLQKTYVEVLTPSSSECDLT